MRLYGAEDGIGPAAATLGITAAADAMAPKAARRVVVGVELAFDMESSLSCWRLGPPGDGQHPGGPLAYRGHLSYYKKHGEGEHKT